MPDGKQPYAIARQDKAPLVFAGLWEGWRGPDEAVLRTFTILTTAANQTMQGLHERMPVVLEESAQDAWLDAEGVPVADALALARPAHDDVLELTEIGTAVNKVANDGQQVQEPVARAMP